MSDEKRDIVADKKLCEEATPGPWSWEEDRWNGGWAGLQGPIVNGVCLEVLYPDHRNEGDEGAAWFSEDSSSEADRRFIAAAREALPYYIIRCEAIEKRIAELDNAWYLLFLWPVEQ
jgi:hypothetical protein